MKKSILSILLLVVFTTVFVISPVTLFAEDASTVNLGTSGNITVKVLLDDNSVKKVQSTDTNEYYSS